MAEFIYNTSLSGFALAADSTKVYEAALASSAPVIAEGSVYTVIWEGKRYVCEATVGLGNALYLGDQGINTEIVNTGEPFLYRYNGDGTGSFRTFDTASSHAIAICEGQGNPTNYLMYERTIAFDADAEGVIHQSMSSVAFPVITVGNTYTVVWDGTYYTCTAKTSTVDTWGEVILLGNVSVNGEIEGEDTEEPFLYIFISSASQCFIQTLSTAAEHTVSIYDGVLRESRYLLYNETLDFAQDNTATGSMYLTQLAEDKVFSAKGGKKYLVVWDGTVYTCKAQENAGNILIGNASLRVDWFPDTGEPFCIIYVAIPGVCGIMTTSTAAQHTVSVYQFSSASNWLMKERALSFAYQEEMGGYIAGAMSLDEGETWLDGVTQEAATQPFIADPPVPGEIYTVVWDGVKYPCTVQAIAMSQTIILFAVGSLNFVYSGSEPSGEPFIWAYQMDGAGEGSMRGSIWGTIDTADTHEVSVLAGEEKTVFENLLLYEDFMGMGLAITRPGDMSIKVGREYTFVINGTEYKTLGMSGRYYGYDVTGFGNTSLVGGEDNGMPFAVGTLNQQGQTMLMMQWLDEATAQDSYIVSLYEGDKPVASDGGGEIVWADPTDVYTYDKDGNPVLHEKRGSVTLDTPDGRYAVFKLSHIADSRN